MPLHRAILTATALAGATGAMAADMLPLTTGVYALATMPCRGAPSSDTMAYWGKDGSLDAPQVECKLKKVSWVGTLYTVDQVCTELRTGEKSAAETINVMISSPTSFTLSGQRYRYCGKQAPF